VSGTVRLNGTPLGAGDGAAVADAALQLHASSASETLLFDLA
jgi:hypothetical protein